MFRIIFSICLVFGGITSIARGELMDGIALFLFAGILLLSLYVTHALTTDSSSMWWFYCIIVILILFVLIGIISFVEGEIEDGVGFLVMGGVPLFLLFCLFKDSAASSSRPGSKCTSKSQSPRSASEKLMNKSSVAGRKILGSIRAGLKVKKASGISPIINPAVESKSNDVKSSQLIQRFLKPVSANPAAVFKSALKKNNAGEQMIITDELNFEEAEPTIEDDISSHGTV